ncbi:hypothetical protein [Burkholderia sp. WAC0059]|uniref:hypothetical protein n=1 Tax=Burkholderia sp. WAC0059 TaxID=2066022 RepID=UPI0011AF028F|nr:hypothetical protein [Burkholderia sp. WAC0059]
MSLRSKRPSKATEAEAAEKPASVFFDNFEPSGAPIIDQRQWREDTGTVKAPEAIEPAQSTSRVKIEGGKRLNHDVLLSDDPRDLFSTHRAERSAHPEEVAKRAADRQRKCKGQEERAWRGWSWLVSLGAGRS